MSCEGIRVLSRKEKNVNFRTATHNFLLREDDQYDGRYFGALQAQGRVRALYGMTIKNYAEEPIKRVRDAISRLSSEDIPSDASGCGWNAPVEAIALVSGLSDADRKNFCDELVAAISRTVIVGESSGHKYSSAAHIVEDVKRSLLRYKRTESKRFKSSSNLYDDDQAITAASGATSAPPSSSSSSLPAFTGSSAALADLPDLVEAFRTASVGFLMGPNPVLVVLLRNSENISPQTFGALVEQFRAYSSVRVLLVLDQCCSTPLPLPIDRGQRSAIALDALSVASSIEFCDTIMLTLLVTSILPVQLPANVLQSLRHEFLHGDCCVQSMLNRLCLYIAAHFQRRCSLIGLSGDAKFMSELKYMKKGKGELAREQKQRRALSGLLPYLSASDLLGTGLDFQKGAGDKYVPPSENKVIDVLFAFQHRQFVDKMTLRLLHRCVAKFIPATERQMYYVDDIWIDLLSVDAMRHADSTLSKLLSSLKQNILSATVDKAQGIMDEVITLFGDESSVIASEPSADSQAYSSAVSAIRNRAKDLLIVAKFIAHLGIAPSSTIRSVKIDGILMSGDAVAISIPNDELVRCFLEDVFNCIAVTVREVCSLPRPHALPGIMTLSKDAVEKGNNYCNSTLRKSLVHALMNPQVYLSGVEGSVLPDACSLFEFLRTLNGKGGTVASLSEGFRQFCCKWPRPAKDILDKPELYSIIDLPESLKRVSDRKRKLELENCLNDDEVMSRFICVVNELQRAGVIKITNNGKNFHKTNLTWVFD